VCVHRTWMGIISPQTISGGDKSRWVVGAAGAGPLVLPSRFPSRPLSVAQYGSCGQ